MSDSMRIAGEASAAAPRLRSSVKAWTAVALCVGLALSGLALGCGPSDTSSFYGGQAGSAGWSGSAGVSGALSGAAGTVSGSAGAAGTSGFGVFDAGGPPATDGAVPPMVVEIDPNGTLSATPGLGVGVFTQYLTGGHWLVWWTCDTTVTGQSCSFTISVTPVQGALSNVEGTQNGATAGLVGATPLGFALTSNTSSGRNQVTFDAPPGASIQLDANVEPAPDQNYLFFVENQRVNGGYQGDLTDPLILEPSSP
jgi:hypothetical protein